VSNIKDTIEHQINNMNTGLPATTGIEMWYQTGEVVTPGAFKRVVEVMRKDMLTNHRESGKGRFRPSNLGRCPRLQIISYRGHKRDAHPTPRQKHLMGSGTWGHYRWQLAGLSSGFFTAIEVPVKHKGLGIEGSADAAQSDGTGFELKTVNANRFRQVKIQGRPFHDHELQVAAYGEASGIDMWSIVYEHRDSSEFLEYRVPVTEDLRLTLQMEIGVLVKHAKNGTLPPMLEGCVKKEGWVYESCPYNVSCPLMDDSATATLF
jgi:hypothetical protein